MQTCRKNCEQGPSRSGQSAPCGCSLPSDGIDTALARTLRRQQRGAALLAILLPARNPRLKQTTAPHPLRRSRHPAMPVSSRLHPPFGLTRRALRLSQVRPYVQNSPPTRSEAALCHCPCSCGRPHGLVWLSLASVRHHVRPHRRTFPAPSRSLKRH